MLNIRSSNCDTCVTALQVKGFPEIKVFYKGSIGQSMTGKAGFPDTTTKVNASTFHFLHCDADLKTNGCLQEDGIWTA